MTINAPDTAAFFEYAKPLEELERAFNAAGLHIAFHLFVHPSFGEKVIAVTGGFSSQKLISIEADSPAAAVKDVAAGVKIC